MPEQVINLKDSRKTWLLYIGVMALLTWVFFGNLRHFPLDAHEISRAVDEESR